MYEPRCRFKPGGQVVCIEDPPTLPRRLLCLPLRPLIFVRPPPRRDEHERLLCRPERLSCSTRFARSASALSLGRAPTPISQPDAPAGAKGPAWSACPIPSHPESCTPSSARKCASVTALAVASTSRRITFGKRACASRHCAQLTRSVASHSPGPVIGGRPVPDLGSGAVAGTGRSDS